MEDINDIIRQLYAQAEIIGQCGLFTGKESTLDDIVRLFTSPQGVEYCIKNNFPSLTSYRLFRPYYEQLQERGIYIDAGAITLKNPRRAIVVGRTSAIVTFDTLDRHEVVVLQGAKCTVGAWKWAVVRVMQDRESEVIKSAYNNAIIL